MATKSLEDYKSSEDFLRSFKDTTLWERSHSAKNSGLKYNFDGQVVHTNIPGAIMRFKTLLGIMSHEPGLFGGKRTPGPIAFEVQQHIQPSKKGG